MVCRDGEPPDPKERPIGMFTVKRSATAVAALAVLLTACGGTDGDVTTTNDSVTSGGETTTEPEQTPTPSPLPTETDPSPLPSETAEPERTPSQPPDDDGSDQTEPSPGNGEPGSSGEPATDLAIRLDPGTGGEVTEWTVTCDPADGSIDDPGAACETLDALSPSDVAPVPKDARCTMIYGGPQTATITGHWDGTKVDLSFSRQNGCEIARWNKMDPILPASDGSEV